jgi:multidrug efflux system membrane fusion protein
MSSAPRAPRDNPLGALREKLKLPQTRLDRRIVWAIVILVGSALWLMSGTIFQDEKRAGAVKTFDQETTPRVRVATLRAEPMNGALSVSGRTEANRAVTLKSETTGRVSEVLAPRGAAVKEGQVLLRVEVQDRASRVAEAKATLESERMQLAAAEKLADKGFNSEIRRAQARAQYEAAEAALKRAKVDLEKTEVRAPFAGILNARTVEVGDFLDKGTEIGEIVELNPLKITGFVAESAVASLARDMKASAIVGGVELPGRISFIAAAADPATRSFRVELEAPNAEGRIGAGMTAELRLGLASRMAVKASPGFLTLNDQGKIGVKLVNADNRVEFAPVEILSQGPDGVWLGGLPADATAITVGQEFVGIGQRVEPVRETAAAATPAPNAGAAR